MNVSIVWLNEIDDKLENEIISNKIYRIIDELMSVI